MSSMREKDQADFDLETFVDLFDTAISSDNPTVQRALKNLILVSSIVNAQENSESLRRGPLRRIIDDITNITRRLNNLESAGAYRSTYSPVVTSPGTAIPGSYPSVFPGTIIAGTSAGDYHKAQAVNQIDVKVGSLLDKLEAK